MTLPTCRKYWKSQQKTLRELLSWASSEGSVGTMLCQALRQPLTQHVQKYVHLLKALRSTLDEVGRMCVWRRSWRREEAWLRGAG